MKKITELQRLPRYTGALKLALSVDPVALDDIKRKKWFLTEIEEMLFKVLNEIEDLITED